MEHRSAIDLQAKGVFIGDGTAVVVDDGLDHRQGRRNIVIADGAGGILVQGQRDGAIGIAISAPASCLVAGKAVFGHRVKPGIERVSGIVQHASAINFQTKGIFIGDGATVVVDDGLDHRQCRRTVIIGDGANGVLVQGQRDGAIGIAVTTPGSRLVTGQAVFGDRMESGIEGVGGVVQHCQAIDLQAKGIFHR